MLTASGVPLACALAALLLVAVSCAGPELGSRTSSTAWDRPEDTKLGRLTAESAPAGSDASGVYLLSSGLDAFAARGLLAETAEHTIDVQYYIWHRDVTGRLLLGRLLAAADRGVRVRCLVDDTQSDDVVEDLAALDAHPLVEVRLFNPFSRSVPHWLDFLLHPARLNHRMHNKLWAVDGAAAIVGGRNLGDEYFEASEGVNFADLDLLAVGPAVREAEADFDAYWASVHSFPMEAWPELRRTSADLDRLRRDSAEHDRLQRDSAYAQRLRSSDLVQRLVARDLPVVWAPARAVADSPEKIAASRKDVDELLLGREIGPVARSVETELVLVSPYLVPGLSGVEYLRELCARGVRVRVLTNSLAATDVPIVHSGYARYRKDMLRAGVEVYELQPSSEALRREHSRGLFGSSEASLHAKTFVFDRKTVFVGSLNLDPRSVDLNTEQGILVESSELAETVLALFERGTRNSYQVELVPDSGGRLTWTSTEADGRTEQYESEPHAGFFKKLSVFLLGILPIEGQI